MSFLAPLFLAGAAAIALPILFHLIRRTIRDKQLFSSLMFLLPTPPKVTKQSRIENWLLLLLRCLVIAALALAFSRPFLKQPVDANLNAQAGSTTLILIDSSASMQRENLWSQAVDEARKSARTSGPDHFVALATFNQRLHPALSLDQLRTLAPDQRSSTFESTLANLKPTWEGSQLGAALQSASEWLDPRDTKSSGSLTRKIIVISDFAEGSHLDTLQGYEWPPQTTVELRPVKVSRPTNAGISILPAKLDSDDLAAGVIRLRVSNAPDSKKEQFTLTLNGGVTNGSQTLDVYVPPGQNRIVPITLSSLTNVTVQLNGDDAPFDNTAYWVPPHQQSVKLLILTADNPTNPNQAAYYVQRAFTSTPRQKFEVLVRDPSLPLNPQDLTGVALVMVGGEINATIASQLRVHASQGHVILWTLPTPAATTGLASFLELGPINAEEHKGPARSFQLLGEIDFKHPLMAPFSDARFNDFTKIHFWKHRQIRESDLPNARTIMRFDNGSAALLDVSKGPIQAYVLTSTWAPGDSQFALSTKFVPLLYSLLERSTGWLEAQEIFTVGDPVRLPTSTNTLSELIKPDGTTWNLKNSTTPPTWDLPGVFRTPATPNQPSHAFAIGLPPDESRTTPTPLDAFEKLGVPVTQKLSAEEQKKADQRKQMLAASELENRQKLWRWLLGFTLLVLLTETWLSGKITRRQSQPATT